MGLDELLLVLLHDLYVEMYGSVPFKLIKEAVSKYDLDYLKESTSSEKFRYVAYRIKIKKDYEETIDAFLNDDDNTGTSTGSKE